MSNIVGVDGVTPEYFMKIHVELKKGREPKKFTIDMAEQLEIDKNDLRGELLKQASNYGFISVCCEMSIAKRDRLEHELEKLRSETYFRLKGGEYAELYEGRVTEKALPNAVELDEQVKAKTEEFLNAKKQAGMLMACKSSLEQRRNMLMSINASMRKEWEDTQ